MMNKTMKMVFWIVLLLILVFYPRLFGIYYTNLFVSFAVFAVFAVSLNMLLGYTGLLSFGHAMFFGTGGYATALALKHIQGMTVLPAVGIGFLAAMILALVLCPLVVRVSGTAFAMLHLAFGQLMYVLALKFRNITGGEDGIGNFPIPDLNFFGVISIGMKGNPVNFYYLALVILGVSLWLMWFLTKTPFGQIQTGIRDNAKRIDYLGYKVPQTKAVVYVISGAFAGIAGSVYGLFHNLVSADGSLGILVSFVPITAVMVGGMGSFFGPIWGTAIFQIIEEIVLRFTDRVELVMGLMLILIIMFAPRGFTGLVNTLKMKWQAYAAVRSGMEKKT
ncbi:MAG: leucine/isoleucine/valine transporter permease subunit [Smithella sp. PtaU1.Bin162]|nr:MAG: leucine/isoleucine/valine transporter permease subunit [Smithella sp. PtaU1.Bin162]